MIVFLLIFIKIEKDIPKYGTAITIIDILFRGFILSWCAGISLLNHLSGGEIIIYIIAIISIAVTPLYRPFNLFVSYGVIHTYFLILLPFFNTSGDHLFSYYINSSSILIMSWAISCMRIKNSVED
ncbi:MAG: hypothetical protein PHF63_08355, partial [Herbinix sp.]|nr:hypothetical protein [Herbinix sp.]